MTTGTWTRMKIGNLVQIEWADSLKRFVRCKTLFGEMPLETAEDLRQKLQSPFLIPAIRRIYQDMLDFAEGKSYPEIERRRNPR